jgi:hypothetical protein
MLLDSYETTKLSSVSCTLTSIIESSYYASGTHVLDTHTWCRVHTADTVDSFALIKHVLKHV